MVWVRDVKPMCWKQDLTQMLGGREGGWKGGREGSREWVREDVHSVGFYFSFPFVPFFFLKKNKKLFDF